MKGIKINNNTNTPIVNINFDASVYRVEKDKGICVIADGTKNKGVLSYKWAQYLCDQSPLEPIRTQKGFQFFLDDIWERFYDTNHKKIKDSFLQHQFEKQGSFSTYTACWLNNKNNKTYYQWLSYGNSTILLYNTKKDELFVPQYKDSVLGFLKNKGLVNWKEDDLKEKYLLFGEKKEFDKDLKIVLATDAMAEHLVLSYLILKAKDEQYWKDLQKMMQSDTKLSELIYQNRGAFSYRTFNEVLDKWQEVVQNKTLLDYISTLQSKGQLAKDDITFQIISYNLSGEEFVTEAEPVGKEETKVEKIIIPVKVPAPKPKTKREFKDRKEKYIDVLLDHKVTKLYHFTDKSNIAMIKKMGGLYSWEYMEQNNKNIPRPGGDQLSRMLDAKYGLENYVRTSFCANHPMMHVAKREGRISNPVVLQIDPAVVTLYNTLFTDMNATKNEHRQGGALEDLEQIKFDICLQRDHFNLEINEKPYYQAEVMVKKFIPTKYILNLNQV